MTEECGFIVVRQSSDRVGGVVVDWVGVGRDYSDIPELDSGIPEAMRNVGDRWSEHCNFC